MNFFELMSWESVKCYGAIWKECKETENNKSVPENALY